MSVTALDAILERLQHSANVRTVYGEPIERGDRTVVPVARVAYGFGGGFGRGGSRANGSDGAYRSESPDSRTDNGSGSGGGVGGGASATPIGALEIDDDGARFVRFDERKRSVTLLLAGLAVGLLVGRRTRRE